MRFVDCCALLLLWQVVRVVNWYVDNVYQPRQCSTAQFCSLGRMAPFAKRHRLTMQAQLHAEVERLARGIQRVEDQFQAQLQDEVGRLERGIQQAQDLLQAAGSSGPVQPPPAAAPAPPVQPLPAAAAAPLVQTQEFPPGFILTRWMRQHPRYRAPPGYRDNPPTMRDCQHDHPEWFCLAFDANHEDTALYFKSAANIDDPTGEEWSNPLMTMCTGARDCFDPGTADPAVTLAHLTAKMHERHADSLPARRQWFIAQCRSWHPDKNVGNEQHATEMFQMLQSKKVWFLSSNPRRCVSSATMRGESM